MTRKEELAYLVGIVTEASKWTLSEDDTRDTIRLEVEHRIGVLLGDSTDTPAEDGRVHDTPKPKPRQHGASHNPGHEGKVHISYNGTKRWVPEEWVTKVPFAQSKTGFRYVPVPEYRAEFMAKFGIKEA